MTISDFFTFFLILDIYILIIYISVIHGGNIKIHNTPPLSNDKSGTRLVCRDSKYEEEQNQGYNRRTIKQFDFFLKPKLQYESHLSRHTSEPMKKKILETRPQSSKNAPKWILKNGKMHDVDKSTLVFNFQWLSSVLSLTLAQKT